MPSYTQDDLEAVFSKSDGHCEYCDKQLSWKNYGIPNGRGGWEVDHKTPLARGGQDAYPNWVAACTWCNRAKSDMSSRQFRASLRDGPTDNRGPSDSLSDLVEGLAILGVAAVGLGILHALLRPQTPTVR